MYSKLLRSLFLGLIIVAVSGGTAQPLQAAGSSDKSVAGYFKEIRTATAKNVTLWGIDLYGPILLADTNRKVYANCGDTANILKKDGEIFKGFLPEAINTANTSLQWSGRNWALTELPLPRNRADRLSLLAHELFHAAQPRLGFGQPDTISAHLDQKEGRIYLRLELEALQQALQTSSPTEMKEHLTNAMLFRKYRHALFPGAAATENQLELHEGMAEYTGFIISGRSKARAIKHLTDNINAFINMPTYVRAFAYQTIPVYGYLLCRQQKEWNLKIRSETNLTDYFLTAFGLSVPAVPDQISTAIINRYGGSNIISSETERETKRNERRAEYQAMFVAGSHFEIGFEKMNIAFNPSNIMPLEDYGMVYPNIRVSDNWGILTVTKAALVSSKWDKITVTSPLKIEGKTIRGDGWVLELNDGWLVIKDGTDHNFRLKRDSKTFAK